MKLIISLSVVFSIILSACSGGDKEAKKKELSDQIQKMEQEMFSSPEVSVTSDKANSIVLLYSRYVNENPEDSLAPLYLFKSGEMFRAVNNGNMSVKYYQRLIDEYPNSEKVPVAIFLQGFVYENILTDMVNAGKFYKLYLEKYPNGEFAKDASVLIENLGKSPEDMIKEFEQKNDTLKPS